jgi:hypothetical protein
MIRYKLKGNISGFDNKGLITIYNPHDYEQPPVLLRASGEIFKYINEIEGTDEEEKYHQKIFTYCSMLEIRKIQVLDENDNIVKTIVNDILGE